MTEDRRPAAETVRALRTCRPDLIVAAGGAHAHDLADGLLVLPASVTAAAEEIDELLHRSTV
jgi:alcohol dehydrogenase class IV